MIRTDACPVADGVPSPPYIKPKGFLNRLMGIRINGLPEYADSKRDPEVKNTVEYEQFWMKELEKIIHGFWIDDIWIPGRFYYYICYKEMSTIDGPIMPDFNDMHLQLAYYIEYCYYHGKNLLCAKGRRKGISEATSTMVIDYGYRFFPGFKGGVAAGKKDYITDFLDKWRYSDSRLPSELTIQKLSKNDDVLTAGYEEKNQLGVFEEKGTLNTIYARTMHTNPNMFKGLYLNAVISEEVGEHENWKEFYGATKDCLKSGQQQRGVLIAFGTAGNVNKGSKDFKDIWRKPEAYNFVRFMIPAQRFYYYGVPKETLGKHNRERIIPSISELYKNYKPYQLIGCEDTELSLKAILDRREYLLKQGDMKSYNEDLQNNPVDEKDMFRKTIVNDFNINKLNDQMALIESFTHPKWTKYKLDWVLDEKKLIKMPYEVTYRALQEGEDTDECVWIIDKELPRKNFMHLYCSGLDSYDQDKAKTSNSLGAMCVRIRNNNIDGAMKNAPVAVISCRPKRKEAFYEMALKLAVMYNLVGNVLVDHAAALVMEYWRDMGGWKYLADRPRKFESESSEQTHEKGVRLTNFSRPRMVALMQTDIEDNVESYFFPELINQLGNFDIMEIGSDNDLADAHGLSLMQDVSFDVKPRDESENRIDDRFDIPQFVSDGEGGVRLKGTAGNTMRNIQQDNNLMKMMFGEDRT